MRFVIFGADAGGSTVGAHLSRADAAALLSGGPPHIERIQTDGLKMSGKYWRVRDHASGLFRPGRLAVPSGRHCFPVGQNLRYPGCP